MKLNVVVVYPTRLGALAGEPGVRFRKHRNRQGTMVPCVLETVDERTVAKPALAVPEGTPAGVFRVQFEMSRVAPDARQTVAIVMAGDRPAARTDPEQHVLAPIYDDGVRMIFEFSRAYVLIVRRRGEAELRLVAVNPRTGAVGTKTIYRAHVRYAPLMLRCQEYLAAAVELFPQPAPREAPNARKHMVPGGAADLTLPGIPSPRAGGFGEPF